MDNNMNQAKDIRRAIVDVAPTEMCFVQYMPISIDGCIIKIPKNLEWVWPILTATDLYDCLEYKNFYLTVKHLYCEKGGIPNRPGWHIDGYGSDDVNYIWYDTCPTEICHDKFNLSEDHEESMRQMEAQYPKVITTYPNKMLLRLDNTVVHRVGVMKEAGMRTFVKISFSNHKYNLEGNAHNYLLDYDWKMYPRNASRNHPFVLED